MTVKMSSNKKGSTNLLIHAIKMISELKTNQKIKFPF